MRVNGKYYKTIWLDEEKAGVVNIIDQRFLPHKFVIANISSVEQMVKAIKDMQVRGAGLIGASAGYGMYLAALEAQHHKDCNEYIQQAGDLLMASRPTAVNLKWAVTRQLEIILQADSAEEKITSAKHTAEQIAIEDALYCQNIGLKGFSLIEEIAKAKRDDVVNILTHCNAGWLAFVDFGSATAPIYHAHDKGIKVHVWVDETRPRNQGASLTAWELQNHGVPHTIIADNTGGYLMQEGLVDLVITGADRVARSGDAANKIGTYLKALAARDNNIPFYIALPSSTFDWQLRDGKKVEIEERNADEVKYIDGLHDGEIKRVLVTPQESPALNFAFDVTPSRLISGLITERGICLANEESILSLFPEKR